MAETLKCVDVCMYALQNQVSVYDVKLLLESPSKDKVTLFQGPALWLSFTKIVTDEVLVIFV